jgi:hypothetical protein
MTRQEAVVKPEARDKELAAQVLQQEQGDAGLQKQSVKGQKSGRPNSSERRSDRPKSGKREAVDVPAGWSWHCVCCSEDLRSARDAH